MARKSSINNEVSETEVDEPSPNIYRSDNEIENLTRMLAAVLEYLSDEDLEEIDIEFLLDDTEGLREWWDRYRERSRKQIEKDIKASLGILSLKELESIHEQIRERQTTN
ncbi:hypothetical protein ACWM35_18275 [Neobacillus sp. K501]